MLLLTTPLYRVIAMILGFVLLSMTEETSLRVWDIHSICRRFSGECVYCK